MTMTSAQLTKFSADLEKLYQDNKDAISTGDTSLDSILYGIGEVIQADLDNYKKLTKEPHSGVIACLESAIDGIRHAAMDYYTSWK